MKFKTTYRANIIAKSYSTYIHAFDNVIDIGCGSGIVGLALARALQCQVTGTDILDYLRVPMPIKIMSAPHIVPFPSHSFDVAMLNEVLHHMDFENQKTVIREALRVADRVVVFEMRHTYFSRVMDILFNKNNNRNVATPFTFRSFDQWRELFGELGRCVDAQRVRKPFPGFPFDHFAFLIVK